MQYDREYVAIQDTSGRCFFARLTETGEYVESDNAPTKPLGCDMTVIAVGHYWIIRQRVRIERPDEFAWFSLFIQRLCTAGLSEFDITKMAYWAFNGGQYVGCDIAAVLANTQVDAVIRRVSAPALITV